MADSWVRAGRLLRTRGRKGELLAHIDSPEPGRAERMQRVLLRRPGQEAVYEVERVWRHAGRPVFKFTGIDSISEAERWEGAEILVPEAERVKLEAGEYYQSDLIGCVVEDASGVIGKVADVEEGAGPLLLHVARPHGGELLIPFAASICRHIDVAAKRIRVDLPEGLAEL